MNDKSTITGESQHVIVYVKREVITHWKRLMDPREKKPFPFIYGSDDKNSFAKYVKAGSVLWVVSSTTEKRPPSLVAKLNVIGRADITCKSYDVPMKVMKVFRDLYKYVAVGDPLQSRFYGYNNAGPALLSLKVQWGQGKPKPLNSGGTRKWKGDYGRPLLRPARVASDPQPLFDLERNAAHSIFISWKHFGNFRRQQDIRKMAYALADAGIFVWFDKFALPSSPSLKKHVFTDKALLERLLWYGYTRCKGLLAFESGYYGTPGKEGNWTKMEWTGEFGEEEDPVPRPMKWVYQFEPSEEFAKWREDGKDLQVEKGWTELAREIKAEMAVDFPIDQAA